MQIDAYLFFEGQAEAALEFYKKALGAEITHIVRYKDSPEPPPPGMVPPGSENKIMHSALRIGDRTLMASDGNCSGKANFQSFSLSLSLNSEEETKKIFSALGDGGNVGMPLGKTFFSPCFGMVTDRFGVGWMVMIRGE